MFKYLIPTALAFVIFLPVGAWADTNPQRAEITPLLTCEWGQDEPFYYSTPTINGQHCRTGCGATALAQVIYYHKHPTIPAQGSYSYVTGRLGTISFDFANASFDYNLMKDSYSRMDPQEDAAVIEVARLMFASGVVLNMDYDLEESSASFGSIPSGLSKWFNYPENGMRQISRDFFTNEEWEQLIYNELENKRPVLYLGGNGTSSHIFVCDGYKDGKFHMNWGWYGEKNGYFSLVNLQTERVKYDGILSLNSGQKIIIGVRGTDDPIPDPVAFAGSFDYNPDSGFTISEMSISYNSVSVIPGVKATADDGTDYYFWSSEPVTVGKGTANISYSIALDFVPDGNYKLRPVYQMAEGETPENEIYSVYCNPRKTRFFKAEISDNDIISAVAGTDANISVSISDFSVPTPFIKGETYNSSFSVFAENNGNTNVIAFKLKFYLPGTETAVTANEGRTVVNLAPGESQTVVMSLPTNLPAGEYDMYVVDGSGGTQDTYPVLSEPIRIRYRDNSLAFKWGNCNLRAMPLFDNGDEAIVLKRIAGSSTEPQGLTGDLLIPETISLNSASEIMTLTSNELTVTEIGPRLVYNESGLNRIVLPATIRNIGSQAFQGCTSVNRVEIDATTPPTLQTKAFDPEITSGATLVVPVGCADVYKNADGWSEFNTIVETTAGDASDSGELVINPFTINPGTSTIVPVTLNTNYEYVGCQFDIELPEGLTIVSDGIVLSDVLSDSDYTVHYSSKSDNSYIIILYSNNHTPLPARTIDLLNITFHASQDFKEGTISVTGIEFSKASGNVDTAVAFEPTSCEVTIDGAVSSISEIEASGNVFVDIYNLAGVLIRGNALFDTVKSSLSPGLYILRDGNNARKVMVK